MTAVPTAPDQFGSRTAPAQPAPPTTAPHHDVPPMAEQVSLIVEHKVKPGHERQYEEWLHNIINVAGTFEGHLGAHVAKPAPGGDNTYTSAVRFADREDALRWMSSDTRKHLMHDVIRHIAAPERLTIKSGIDYWFTPATKGITPPRWKQWMTTVSVIWPLSIIVPHVLGYLYREVPILGHTPIPQLIGAMCTVGLLVYVIMPRYSRLLAKWLSKN